MLRIVFSLLAFIGIANAQQNQQRVATTTINVTTQVVSAFQLALPSASRNSCTLQYQGAGTGYVFFGPTASAASPKSFVLSANQSILCAVSGVTLTDPVSITSTATGDNWAVTTQ